MRKDVKLGLAVGGVLLAVLVVYVLVVPGSNRNQVGATLENLDESEAEAAGETAGGGAAVAQGEANSAGKQTGSSSQEQQARPGDSGATADAGARTGASGGANAGSTSNGADNAAANTGAANTGASTAKDNATAGGGWNWDALVNGTEKLPALGAATDVPANGVSGGGSNHDATGPDAAPTATGNAGATAGNAAPTGSGAASSVGGTSGNATAQGGAGDATPSLQPAPTRPGATAGPTDDAPPAAAAGKHVVKTGDTYSRISQAVYGTSRYYAEIEHANPGIDPTRLKPGMTINVPALGAAKPAAAPAAAQTALDPQKEYKVQPNDSLYTISLRLYGKADRVEKLYELNKPLIGDDLARVKVGMVLKLPEPPTQSTAAATAR